MLSPLTHVATAMGERGGSMAGVTCSIWNLVRTNPFGLTVQLQYCMKACLDTDSVVVHMWANEGVNVADAGLT